MTPNEYQNLAMRSKPEINGFIENRLQGKFTDLVHAHFGMSSETGEVADAIKKYLIYGKEFDTLNVIEECGDLLWYISLCLSAVNCSLESCMTQNLLKLRIRYPEKFTEKDAVERKDKISPSVV